ncbi:nucleoside hydrolase-like [Rhynchophorus ferrugineus]|uniref:Inosine/uridine-preferring nucleoside hydrolase domain-containing protein n=1 Tax=Rhynchophorus ferrugineus TaxID=354439 RepID=A0A834ML00_RHYFE|nr:hypothetical protein GWI33_022632 [Rhynchophorus ferrugineus]
MRRVIVDVDVGSDDYLAILILLYAEKLNKVRVEAITCTSGNTNIHNVIKNTVRLLELIGRTDIPIFEGAYEPLMKCFENLNNFHGKDGFGDLLHDDDPDLSIVRKEHAAVAIASLVEQNYGEISLVCLGPLTNIALAIKMNKHFSESVKDIWLMGGNHLDNVKDLLDEQVEFNFAHDPEAADIVLKSMKNSIFILPWETTERLGISLDWRYNILGDKTPVLKLLTEAERRIWENSNYWQPCDAFLAFAYIHPDKYILKSSNLCAKIILEETKYKGFLSLEKNGTKNVMILEDIDKEMFKKYLLELALNS